VVQHPIPRSDANAQIPYIRMSTNIVLKPNYWDCKLFGRL